MPPRLFRRVRPAKAPPVPVPQATARPPVVAPSSAQPATRAQLRRGQAPPPRSDFAQAAGRTVAAVARPVAVAGGTAGVIYAGSRAVDGFFTSRARDREAARAQLQYVQVPTDLDGDGVFDSAVPTPVVLGQDGAYDVFGAEPTFQAAGAPTTGSEVRDTAKTLGLVVGGLVVVGGIVYLVTRPGVAKAIGRAVK